MVFPKNIDFSEVPLLLQRVSVLAVSHLMAVPRGVLESFGHLGRFIVICGFNLPSVPSFSQLLCENSHLVNWERKRISSSVI